MKLREPAQSYSTTIFDRYQPQSISFHFIPARSFTNSEVPEFDIITNILEATPTGAPEIAPWHLPVLLSFLLSEGSPLPVHLLPSLAHGAPTLIEPDKLGF